MKCIAFPGAHSGLTVLAAGQIEPGMVTSPGSLPTRTVSYPGAKVIFRRKDGTKRQQLPTPRVPFVLACRRVAELSSEGSIQAGHH
jgi:hypothetical protein